MAGSTRKKSVFANPFYVGLMVVSSLFVVTALGYLFAPDVLKQGPGRQRKTSLTFAVWLDRHGPLILGIEFVVMLVTGVLAMATDDWFSAAK